MKLFGTYNKVEHYDRVADYVINEVRTLQHNFSHAVSFDEIEWELGVSLSDTDADAILGVLKDRAEIKDVCIYMECFDVVLHDESEVKTA